MRLLRLEPFIILALLASPDLDVDNLQLPVIETACISSFCPEMQKFPELEISGSGFGKGPFPDGNQVAVLSRIGRDDYAGQEQYLSSRPGIRV